MWIHWPEALFHWSRPTDADLDLYHRWLRSCNEAGIVVWTVHNLFRHTQRNDSAYTELYRLTAEEAKIHLHHGSSSIGMVNARYPTAKPRVVRVFQHGGYWNLLGDHTREWSLKQLGIGTSDRVLLVFGNVRDPRELLLVWRASRVPGWHILVAGRIHSSGIFWRRAFNRLIRLAALPKWTTFQGVFEDGDVDRFVKAADAVFIPRYESLNSGNVFLGFTFAKPVVGPNIGNIGEVLRMTGNPTFDPKDPNTIVHAIEALEGIDMEAVGRRNAAWLEQNCQWDQVASAAIQAIEEFRGSSRRRSV